MNKFVWSKIYLLTIISMLCINVEAYDYGDQQDNLRLIDRLDRVEHELTTLQKQFYSGVPLKQGQGSSINSNIASSLDNRIDAVEEQMRELVGKIEQIEHSINNLNKKLVQSTVSTEAAGVGSLSAADKTGVVSDQTKSLGTVNTKLIENVQKDAKSFDDSMEEEFKKAFTLLKTSQLDDAMKAFSQFIEKYPNSDLTSEAYYWLAEIYYSKKNYENASINFLRGYKLAPKSDKAADSLFKLALSLKNLQKNKDSCAVLDKLSTNFPNLSSVLKDKIRNMQAELGCK